MEISSHVLLVCIWKSYLRKERKTEIRTKPLRLLCVRGPGLSLKGGSSFNWMIEALTTCGTQEAEPGQYPADVLAPLLAAFQAAKVAAVYYQAMQAAEGGSADVARHIRPAVNGAPQRQPPAFGHAIIRSAPAPIRRLLRHAAVCCVSCRGRLHRTPPPAAPPVSTFGGTPIHRVLRNLWEFLPAAFSKWLQSGWLRSSIWIWACVRMSDWQH